jgi:hypothetical protein
MTGPRLSFGWQAGAFPFWSTSVTPLIRVWQAQAVSSHDAHHAANQAQLRLLQKGMLPHCTAAVPAREERLSRGDGHSTFNLAAKVLKEPSK